MSYDLYFSSPQLDPDAFARHFEGRAHYESPGSYVNDDTGVYFNFHLCEADEQEAADPSASAVLRAPHAAFNINYFRPHVFGLEAEPEVTAFVEAFGCAIHDPQTDGMGDDAYSPEGFLRGWNKGNAFGYSAIGELHGVGDALIADDALIERVWRWNFGRRAQQAAFGDDRFLPRVSWAKRRSDGGPIAYTVWGQRVATAFPDCATHALLAREQRGRPAPSSGANRSTRETSLMSIADVAALAGCAWREISAGRVLLAPVDIPPHRAVLAAFDGHFTGLDSVAAPVGPDRVLNASLTAQ